MQTSTGQCAPSRALQCTPSLPLSRLPLSPPPALFAPQSDDKEWVGKASMSKRHRFLLTKDLSWWKFNALTFGMQSTAHLREAVAGRLVHKAPRDDHLAKRETASASEAASGLPFWPCSGDGL